ncbi:MAG TPA: nuclear transport factor 2 family protein [Thermoanaerobaculia bacterium]|nr:nuclear transport factor 2 family protein [Thermoanaerobaculia bacterium]
MNAALPTVLAIAAMAVASRVPSKTPPTGGEKEVRDATSRFHAALNALFQGDAAPMSKVWSHAADVSAMGPDGAVNRGWDAVEEYWRAQAALKLGGKVEAADLQVTMGTDMATTSNFEKGENTNAKGETQRVSIRATNVFRKEKGQWKMVGHHTDLLPYLAKD